jgi:cytochrome c oxidase subunit 2
MKSWFSLQPEQASTFAADVDALYWYLWALTAFFFVLLVTLMIVFTVKYRRRTDQDVPRPIAGSIKLETVWTVIPFIISLSVFAWASSIYVKMVRHPADAMDVYVVGKQWMWKFQHPEGQREINELHVPAGKKVRLVMATEDVLHSMFIPAFRVKQDVVPGANRFSSLWFEATKPGKYHIFCAEYCGTQHSGMIGSVYVMEPVAYQQWLAGGANTGGSMVQQGEKLFSTLGCVTCHQAGGLGPQLEGVFGKKRTFTDGQSLVADESYIRESILNSQAHVVAGYQPIMPVFQGQISEEQLMQLVAFVKGSANSGQPGGTDAPAASTALPGTIAAGRTPTASGSAEGANPVDVKSGTEVSRTTEQASPQSMAPKR